MSHLSGYMRNRMFFFFEIKILKSSKSTNYDYNHMIQILNFNEPES